ncbi:LAMI_0H03268g1_1 [Lachancea mirantina]|uniref:LAMI_0H03268g1_1 n=1 Tax=Lachancea mirantina TaxID=1230905 RepID=A0A1G4KE87_9SACH|nr:LAMI_0H03268g1_1 [Lachancea mirantina]
MLVDLNVPWPQTSFKNAPTASDIQKVRETLSTLSLMGYTHIALNFTISQGDKFPSSVKDMNPIKIEENFGDLMKSSGLKLYSRLTLIIDDPSKGQSLSKISQAYDIVSAMPISERGLTLATGNLDVDLLTFRYDQRLPTFLKHKNICSCVNRGVKLEIVYAYALRDMQARRQFIQNAKSVIRSSRSRGIVISSGAEKPLECRNLLSACSLVKFLGLSSDKCNKAMGELPALVLLNGRLRNRSYKQTVVVGGGIGHDTDVVNATDGIDATKMIKIVKRKRADNIEDPSKERDTPEPKSKKLQI